MVSPRKDSFGKRTYSQNDLNILFRIRYLIYEERYTLEGVKKRLWKEMEEADLDWRGRIHQVRGNILKLYMVVKKQKKLSDKFRIRRKDVDTLEDA